MNKNSNHWEHADGSWLDPAYEWKAVLLLALGFGLVGLDRWIIAPLFPQMAKDLHLNYSDLGVLAGVLAIAWGVCSTVFGRISDRYGRREVLIPALIGFSLLAGVTGVVGGMLMLVLVRAAMGASEGAYLATSVAATAEASRPARRGLNQGLQFSLFPLLGFGVGPILATQLLGVLPSWRYVFLVVSVPGLIVAALLYRILRDQPHLKAPETSAPAQQLPWADIIRSPNVLLAAGCLLCAMSCIFVMGAMVPSYLSDYLHFPAATMGFILSGMGWGGFLGEFMVPGASDWIGRRWATCIAFVGAFAGTWAFAHAGPNPLVLFAWLNVTSFFALGLTSILTGPVATEAVAPGLKSSAIGMVSGAGEIFGGGIGPVIAGIIAQRFGIQHIFYVPFVGLAIGVFLSLVIRETAPRRAARPL